MSAHYRSTTLVSFATQAFRDQQICLSQSAVKIGIDYIACWNEDRLSNEQFFERHKDIFRYNVGFGCWLWKPYIIRYELARMADGAFLIYWDVGRREYPHRFEQSPQPLLAWCVESNGGILPGVYIPQFGPNKHWTKRDCFVAMNCDYPEYWDHPQVQATFSIWQKNQNTIEFINEWLRWCQYPEVITDEPNRLGYPNFDGFIAHRHDQSVLTNLVINHKLKCFGDTKTPLLGDKDINNLIDYVCGKEHSIRRRELRKRLYIHAIKSIDPAWWYRNIGQVTSGVLINTPINKVSYKSKQLRSIPRDLNDCNYELRALKIPWWVSHRPYQLLQTLYWDGFRGRFSNYRMKLFNADKRPVPLGLFQQAVARYGGICETLLSELANGPDLRGAYVCELGAGNCLATTALFLGLGAQQVEVFEPNAPLIDKSQHDLLNALRDQGLPLDVDGTLIGFPPRLDTDRIKWHLKFVETEDGCRQADFIFSFSVLEHVEDLLRAMAACFNLMKPGARTAHVIDLGGHGFFEDPMPPLDFQVYPDWLYSVLYPKYGRATRRPIGEYVASARAAGFQNVVARPIRFADPDYLDSIWPHLNPRIRRAGRDDVRIIEFVLSATKANY